MVDFAESFKNLISLFQELASLLKDSDRLMGEEGYITFNGNTVAYEQSRSVTNPESWFPAYLSRIYNLEEQAEEKLDHLLFINIFLRYGSGGCRDVKMIDNVPLVIAGLIVPNNPRFFKSDVFWVTKSWFWANEPGKDNVLDENISEIRVINPKNKGDYYDSKFIKTFACPLEEIRGTADLKTKIIEKLLRISKIE